jgi:hypothetical protein
MEAVGLLLNPGDSTEIVRGPRGPPIFTTSTASISRVCVDGSEVEDGRLIAKHYIHGERSLLHVKYKESRPLSSSCQPVPNPGDGPFCPIHDVLYPSLPVFVWPDGLGLSSKSELVILLQCCRLLSVMKC